MANCSEIYAAVWHGSQPYQLPGLWQRFTSHESFRLLTAENVLELRGCFDEGDLQTAGVLGVDDHHLAVHPALAQLPAPLLFVRAANGPIIQIIAGMCGIGPHIGALAALLADHSLRQLIADSESGVVLVSSMVDLAILWALGIPAALATGLARVTGKPLQKLVSTLKAGRRSLVLSDCWVERLERGHNPYLGFVERHLATLERHLPIEIHRRWWTPSVGRLEDVAFALLHGSDSHVGEAVYDSIVDGDPLPRSQRLTARTEPSTVREALAEWQERLRFDHGHDTVVAWENLHRLIHSEFGAGLLLQASRQSDPRARCKLTTAAAVVPPVLTELYALHGQLLLSQKEWRSTRTSLSESQLKRIAELMKLLRDYLGGCGDVAF